MSERTAKRLRREQVKVLGPGLTPHFGNNRRYFRERIIERGYTRPGSPVVILIHAGTGNERKVYRKIKPVVNDYGYQRADSKLIGTNHQRMLARAAMRETRKLDK